MALSGEARELPNALVAIAAGASGDFEVALSADADESGGADIQQLFRVKLTPVISAAHPGTMSLKIETTPVKGDASDAPTVVDTVAHAESMDAWQSAAGRARQV